MEAFSSKYPLILVGFIGFCSTFAIGFFNGSDLITMLRNALVAAIFSVIVMKFFLAVLRKNFILAQKEKIKRLREEEERSS